MLKNLISCAAVLSAMVLQAQDTLTVMQYNLLNYGNYTSYCSMSVNNTSDKDQYLKLITAHVKPDIFSVNEMAGNVMFSEQILSNVLNADGETKYARITVPNQAGSDLTNMVYFNTDKVMYHSSAVAQALTRDIDVVKFYYQGAGLAQGDTVFVYCVVAHLKAGEGTANASERMAMVSNAMNYLQAHYQPCNFLFMGDLNLYSPTEGAFSLLTQTYGPSWIFHDPAGRVGEWHSNALYSDVHTQSTHSGSGCWASGGMDDRFDFILASNSIMDGSRGMQYLNGSYYALGQDGNHFNKALTDAPDVPLPASLVQALYKNSDHLPVVIKLKVDPSLSTSPMANLELLKVVNPASGSVKVMCSMTKSVALNVKIYSLVGTVMAEGQYRLTAGTTSFQVAANSVPSGIYMVAFTQQNGSTITRKVIIQ